MQLTYIKEVNIPQLTQEINKIGLSLIISLITSSGNIVIISTTRNLSIRESSSLYNVINNHVVPDPAQEAIKMKVEAAVAFGHQFLIDFSTQNILMGITATQISSLVSRYGFLITMFQSGYIYTALHAIENLTPDDIITPERKIYAITKIKNFLASS